MLDDGKDDVWEGLPARTRLQGVGEFSVMLAVTVAGALSSSLWPALFVGAVAFLFITDRGQHRALVDRFESLGRGYVAGLSVGSHLLNNLFFCALAFGAGRIWRLFWFDVLDGRAGAWSDLAVWCAFELAVVGLMHLLWWMSGNRIKYGRWW
jgi:hypothetical protein